MSDFFRAPSFDLYSVTLVCDPQVHSLVYHMPHGSGTSSARISISTHSLHIHTYALKLYLRILFLACLGYWAWARMPYCESASEDADAGLLKSRSVPALVLGKAMTSRIDSVLHRMLMRRSKPGLPVHLRSCMIDGRTYQRQTLREAGLHNEEREASG